MVSDVPHSPTIPPAGIAPTMPPPPPTRARRSILFALTGCVLLALAVAWQNASQPAPGVFVADSTDDLGALGRRVLFMTSAIAHGIALPGAYAALSFNRGKAVVSILLSAAWLVGLLYSQLG